MTISALVIGAGITGLATARALVKRGVAVTVIERGPVPNPIASSYDRHRLIRPHYPDRPVYCRRIREAFDAWDGIWADLGSRHYVETGVLSVSLEAGDWTDRARGVLDAVGEPYEAIEPAAFAARYPQFAVPDMAYALLTPRGGALLADRILQGLEAWLRAQDVAFVDHAPVLRLDPAAGRVHVAGGRVFQADVVIAAPGVGAPDLFDGLVDVDLVPRRSVLLYVEPPAGLAAAWAASPAWVDLGGEEEYWGMPPLDGIPMKLGLGAVAPHGDPHGDRFVRPAEIATIFDRYRARIADVDGFRLVEGHANWWTMAPEERFVLARRETTWLLSACSGHGFKFGALTGEDVARAVLGEEDGAVVADRLAGRETGDVSARPAA